MKTIVYVDGLNLYYGSLRVNLAADFISDACHDRCKQAVLCSNDRDLVGALTAVRRDHSDLVVGLVAPVRDPHHASRDLSKLTRWCKVIRSEHLARAQLPERIPGTQLTRPEQWKENCAPRDRESARPAPNAA